MKKIIYSLLVIVVIACNKKESVEPVQQQQKIQIVEEPKDTSFYIIAYKNDKLISATYGNPNTYATQNDSVWVGFDGIYDIHKRWKSNKPTYYSKLIKPIKTYNSDITKSISEKGFYIKKIWNIEQRTNAKYYLIEGSITTKLFNGKDTINIKLVFKTWLITETIM